MKRELAFLMLSAALMALSSCQPKTNQEETTTAQPASKLVQSPSVTETIMARRSIRKYKSQPVEKDKLQQIVTCGIWAPNGQGKESWQVRMVTDRQLLDSIDSRYGKAFAYGAPAVAFIAYDPQYDLSQIDCGLLGGNMILAAQSMGLGSCCLGGIVRFLNQEENKDLLDKLDIPESHTLLYAIALGYPDEKPKAKERHTDRVKFLE